MMNLTFLINWKKNCKRSQIWFFCFVRHMDIFYFKIWMKLKLLPQVSVFQTGRLRRTKYSFLWYFVLIIWCGWGLSIHGIRNGKKTRNSNFYSMYKLFPIPLTLCRKYLNHLIPGHNKAHTSLNIPTDFGCRFA